MEKRGYSTSGYLSSDTETKLRAPMRAKKANSSKMINSKYKMKVSQDNVSKIPNISQGSKININKDTLVKVHKLDLSKLADDPRGSLSENEQIETKYQKPKKSQRLFHSSLLQRKRDQSKRQKSGPRQSEISIKSLRDERNKK
ncbi:unnamed protein product [Moneuplotes crassus]|uniref:Uncharacterized protein n=1 Tax=Euplotes crassus TaxID=5936 RepID=A0AAD2D6T6_EUPCR|nr:unnamed protein product [Moneuplotes crassus]